MLSKMSDPGSGTGGCGYSAFDPLTRYFGVCEARLLFHATRLANKR
jgi:hypothetical protein